MLETAPSFSIYSMNPDDGIEKALKIENKIDEKIQGSGDFSFVKPNMDLIKEEGGELDEVIGGLEKMRTGEEVEPPSPPMYLASGLGIGDGAHIFGEGREVSEEYCRELREEYPNHPLVLSKYAELLQAKGDLQGAEEYYFRATQAGPGDGEILLQYAKLLWDLYHDPERALTYFELAVQNAPQNSYVLAGYAKFLWEVDDDDDDDDDGEDIYIHPNPSQEDNPHKSVHLHLTDGNGVGSDGLAGGNSGPTVDVEGSNVSADIGNYYKRMIQENPSNAIFLKKYTEFLYQSKGDLQGAEEYYSRAVLADPQDGEMLSQYATLIWELYHDQDRTLSYLERAIEAAPQDSNVLAAYARILWAIDDE